MRWAFRGCVFDAETRELERDGRAVAVEPQVLRILEHLIEHRSRVVTKDELLSAVWGGPFVSDAALTSRIRDARAAVGDDGRRQAVLRTVRGIGYRFAADVRSEVAASGRPIRPTLIGRDRELAEVHELLDHHRVVTVCGPGGAGKTALACAVAAEREVGLVELAGLGAGADGQEVAARIAGELGVQPSPDGDLLRGLADALDQAGRRLIVVDNAEHVVAGLRSVLRAVLDRADDVRVLVTSRRRLDLGVEGVLVVRSLDRSHAAQLVADRVREAGSLVDVDDAMVAELCDRLDGLPLALELAAARIARSGLAATVEAVRRGEHDRLTGPVDAESRHASLDATVQWSVELLSAPARELLAGLAVFAGGFVASDAAEVCIVAADGPEGIDRLLDELAEASLIVPVAGSGPQRYRLPFLLREQGKRRLEAEGTWAALAERHARHVAHLARRFAAHLEGEAGLDWIAWLEEQLDDVRAAVRFGLAVDDPTIHLAIVASVAGELVLQQRFEVLEWLAASRAATPDGSPHQRDRIVALAQESEAAGQLGDYRRRDELNEELRRLLDERPDLGDIAFYALALPRFFAGELSVAEVERWVDDIDERLDPVGANHRLLVLTLVRIHHVGDLEGARASAERHVRLTDEVPLPRWKGWARYTLAEAWLADDPSLAIELYEEALAAADRIGHRYLAGIVRVGLATARRATGDRSGAAADLHSAISVFSRQGNWQNQWPALRTAIELLDEVEPSIAEQLAVALARRQDVPPAVGEQAERMSAIVARRRGSTGAAVTWTSRRVVTEALAALAELAARAPDGDVD